MSKSLYYETSLIMRWFANFGNSVMKPIRNKAHALDVGDSILIAADNHFHIAVFRDEDGLKLRMNVKPIELEEVISLGMGRNLITGTVYNKIRKALGEFITFNRVDEDIQTIAGLFQDHIKMYHYDNPKRFGLSFLKSLIGYPVKQVFLKDHYVGYEIKIKHSFFGGYKTTTDVFIDPNAVFLNESEQPLRVRHFKRTHVLPAFTKEHRDIVLEGLRRLIK